MMKKKGFLAAYISIVSALLISMLVSTTVARYVKDAESGGSYGEVAIRSYYDSGTGKSGDPYRITRPIHLYNLSRLQGLGCYSGTGENKTYFQLGKEVKEGNKTVYKCYADDETNVLDRNYLDMRNYTHTIEAIGSETTPFYGDFDGKNLEIRNLTVYADPQDAGLFGYTAHASKVHDLFLDNVTINTKGYSKNDSGLRNLYDGAVSKFTPKFTYSSGGEPWEYKPDSSITGYKDETTSFTVDWTNQTTSDVGPSVGWSTSYTGSGKFKYKLLPSGGLLSDPPNTMSGTFNVNTDAVIEHFVNAKSETNPVPVYPLTASSSMSILAYMTTSSGYLRSRVLLTLSFDFTLPTADSTKIYMSIHRAREHGNNIGLVIGHCDGTVNHCYVHNGKFVMNDGVVTEYQGMENGSDIGLIGVQGNTVKNVASEDAGVSAREGKTVGILDFSNVYKTVTGASSTYTPVFTEDSSARYQKDDGEEYYNSFRYTPSSSAPDYYKDMLRRNNSMYYTAESNSIAFKGQEVIQGSDLGVFKIATDHASDGIDGNVLTGIANTVVKKDNPLKYLYYSTGEFSKNDDQGHSTGETFASYRDSFSSDLPSRVIPGYHFPKLNEMTWQSFSTREQAQNYFVRFKMDSNRSSFYFSDLDRNTVGGSFLTKYLEYKLVDEENNHIYVNEDGTHKVSSACGLTFKDKATKLELSELSASFATRDISNKSDSSKKMWCINNASEGFPVANMVNFEITTDWANVTVVAAPKDRNKSAALGVYKIDPNNSSHYGEVNVTNGDETITYKYAKRDFDDPDYAFFMPNDQHLAYYDYKYCNVNASGIEVSSGSTPAGRIGTYYNGTDFKQATYGTPATVPGAIGAAEHFDDGYSSSDTRLFVHTFKLPRGHYFFGSPTGTSSKNDAGDLGLSSAKIYYVCAQGQEEGDTDFVDNSYGEDIVDNVDFVKAGRADIKIEGVDTIGDGDGNKLLKYQRCYVMLSEKDRSSFSSAKGILSFTYSNSMMVIAAEDNTLNSMTKVVVASYGHKYGIDSQHLVTDLENTVVKLFGYDANDDELNKHPKETST